ncbi:hypothetical protein GXW82_32020 [Streptacidiphilus sp. 4-A2]|nr:hypothetical protein [Streptacidiphilus sp. 4-A2]
MLATRLAKAAAVTALAVGSVLLVPSTANAGPAVAPIGAQAGPHAGSAPQN